MIRAKLSLVYNICLLSQIVRETGKKPRKLEKSNHRKCDLKRNDENRTRYITRYDATSKI